jgi:hypothetical protein
LTSTGKKGNADCQKGRTVLLLSLMTELFDEPFNTRLDEFPFDLMAVSFFVAKFES